MAGSEHYYGDCYFCGLNYYRPDGHSCAASIEFNEENNRKTEFIGDIERTVFFKTKHMDEFDLEAFLNNVRRL